MPSTITESQFECFLTDPNLARAIEASKRVDDVFDMINPSENQHSCILQWLFDPREGHGQGESIFKDFLNAAYEADVESVARQKLFLKWTPGQIAITGFQSLIVVREKEMVGKGRQDLLLVDPIHKFVILVENKAGAHWGEKQLKEYRTNLIKLTLKGKPYEGFMTGLVLLDRFKDGEPPANAELKRWAYIDYSWLEKAARRAEARAERGVEPGQQLVIAYCRRQAEYESKEERALDELLARLAQSHREVAAAIGKARRKKCPEKADLLLNNVASQLWVWTHQYKDLAVTLEQQKALSFIKPQLIKNAGDDKLVFDLRKRAVYVAAQSWELLMDDDRDDERPKWPVCIKVLEKSRNGAPIGDKQLYSVMVEFRPEYLKAGLEKTVRDALIQHYANDLKTHATARVRRLGRLSEVSEANLAGKVSKMFALLQEALSPFTSKD